MDDIRWTKASLKQAVHVQEKPFRMVHLTHPRQKQARQVCGAVLVMV